MTQTQDRAPRARSASPRTLSRLFWGTIILLMGITLGLALMAWLRAPERAAGHAPGPSAASPSAASPIRETITEAAKRLEDAKKQTSAAANAATKFAYEDTKKHLSDRLDEAYKPAFAALPGYVDFHYSVLGEYAELAGAALGKSQQELQRRVFDGLDDGIRAAANSADERFNTSFAKHLDAKTAQFDVNMPKEVRDVVELVRADLTGRVIVTAPVASAASTAAAIGGAKLASKAVAGKLAAKVMQKTALKLGGKWAGVAAGAGGGALVCSWSGPVAGACAVVAGGITWFTVDHVVIKLDEHFSRDDFEGNLRQHIRAHRARTEALMLASLERRRDAMQANVEKVSARMVPAAELTRDRLPDLCRQAKTALHDYHAMRTDLWARHPDKVLSLQAGLAELQTEKATQEWAARMEANLTQNALSARITEVMIAGNLPGDLRANTEFSGWFEIGGLPIFVNKVDVDKALGFTSHISIPALEIDDYQPIQAKLSLQQHRYRRDRYFVGEHTFSYRDILTRSRPGDGLTRYSDLLLLVAQDSDADDLESATTGDGLGMNLNLRLALSAAALPEMGLPTACP